jgi:hypothetical protein
MTLAQRQQIRVCAAMSPIRPKKQLADHYADGVKQTFE